MFAVSFWECFQVLFRGSFWISFWKFFWVSFWVLFQVFSGLLSFPFWWSSFIKLFDGDLLCKFSWTFYLPIRNKIDSWGSFFLDQTINWMGRSKNPSATAKQPCYLIRMCIPLEENEPKLFHHFVEKCFSSSINFRADTLCVFEFIKSLNSFRLYSQKIVD